MWRLLGRHPAWLLADDVRVGQAGSPGSTPGPATPAPPPQKRPPAAARPADGLALSPTALRAGVMPASLDQRIAAVKWYCDGFTPADQERSIQAILRETVADPAAMAKLLAGLEARGVSFPDLIGELGPGSNPLVAAWLSLAVIPRGIERLGEALGDPVNTDPGSEAGRVQAVAGSERALALRTELLALLDPVQTPLAPGVDRDDLFSATLRDLASPAHISQGGWGTCGATGVQIALALRDPARYVAMVRALASPVGDASALVPGLHRPDWDSLSGPDAHMVESGADVVVGADRSITTRLLSVAFMSYATDGRYEGSGGLQSREDERLLAGVLGWKVDTREGSAGDPAVWEALDRSQRAGNVVPVGLRWRKGNHLLLYAGTAHDRDGQEYALLLNPWGKRHAMPLARFKERLFRAHLPVAGSVPVPRPDRGDDLRTYERLDESKFMTATQIEHAEPAFQRRLEDFVSRNGLSAAVARSTLSDLSGSDWFGDKALERLQRAMDQRRATEDAKWRETLATLPELSSYRDSGIRTAVEQEAVVQGHNLLVLWGEPTLRRRLQAGDRDRLLDLAARMGLRLDQPGVNAIRRLVEDDRLDRDLWRQLEAATDPAAILTLLKTRAERR